MSLREKSDQYREHLAQTCRALFTSPVVLQRAPNITQGARQLFESLRINERSRRGTFRLALEPNWKIEVAQPEICGSPGETELHFGGEILFEDRCLERQVLTVLILFRSDQCSAAVEGRPALRAGEYYVVRRFHFDFDRSVVGQGTPLAHVQIGGNLNREHLAIDGADPLRYELFDQLDFPRLPWTIIDLAIVIHTFLRQFPTRIEGLIHGSAWRQRVMDSERLWLADFYRHTATMMEGDANRETFYDYTCIESTFDQ